MILLTVAWFDWLLQVIVSSVGTVESEEFDYFLQSFPLPITVNTINTFKSDIFNKMAYTGNHI